ncbi:hypothetical protein BKA62DRAFT_416116 [Auriculariales sp. MPI-PUGE-AT-0066]|nr:hypothetical protein BKA62DRAFT_416116 [Auriculariales sp. MPI-PUGE-AT-0066]
MDRPPSVTSSTSSFTPSSVSPHSGHLTPSPTMPAMYGVNQPSRSAFGPSQLMHSTIASAANAETSGHSAMSTSTLPASTSMSAPAATATLASVPGASSPTQTLPAPGSSTSECHQQQAGDPQDPPKKKVKKVKMHPCSICGKEFPRPSGLQTHMNVHSGARPYECPVPGCPKRFGVRSNATRHLRVHQKAREHAELQAARAATNGFSVDWINSLPDQLHAQHHAHAHPIVPSHGLPHANSHLVEVRPMSSSSALSYYSSSSQGSRSSLGVPMLRIPNGLDELDVGGMQVLHGTQQQSQQHVSPQDSASISSLSMQFHSSGLRSTPADVLSQSQSSTAATHSTGYADARSYGHNSYGSQMSTTSANGGYTSSPSSYTPSSYARASIYQTSPYDSGSASPATPYSATQVAPAASTSRATGSYGTQAATHPTPSLLTHHSQHTQRAQSISSVPVTAPSHIHSHGNAGTTHSHSAQSQHVHSQQMQSQQQQQYNWVPNSLSYMQNVQQLPVTPRGARVEVGDDGPPPGAGGDGEWRPYHPTQWKHILPGRESYGYATVGA